MRGQRALKDFVSTLFGPPLVREVLKRLPVSALGAASHQLHSIAGMVLASFLAPGGISALYFAERLVELPLALAGAALGIAALPRFVSLAAAGELSDMALSLGRSIRMGAFFSLPATAGLFVLARPLSDFLFGHGAYADGSAGLIAAVLRGYVLALPALCASRPLLAAANALQREGLPLTTALASMLALFLASAGALLTDGSPENAALGLGLGLALAAWCNAALLLRGVCRGLDISAKTRPLQKSCSLVREGSRGIGYYAAAAALMALGLTALPPGLHPAALIALIALCAAAWIGLFLALRSEDARAFAGIFRRS